MPDTYSSIFTAEELEFLRANADEYGWYVWNDETRPIIEALCARRLMAANGDFKVVAKEEHLRANLAGHGPRVADAVVRYYELIGTGRIAFHVLQHRRPAMTAPPLAEQRGTHTAHM
ncbi:hypothetical protein GCM10007874_26000 [Labrys miyagiensis]|uniref:Uncharacterized protein n=1 Tax=Labrys miyagiensis TaxID=346912 RepID=A0ABQ6CIP2_9HYPH|nr:hypothetical protein [Labrys miyagiensis]GLS19583.1 hypothetical protein GCM10007874_26000 [Labrys miyagiensis]